VDLRLFIRTVARFKGVAAIGCVLAIVLAFFSFYSIGPTGIRHRTSETWMSESRLLVTLPDFALGSTTGSSPGGGPTDPSARAAVVEATQARLPGLAAIYANLATSDVVLSFLHRQRPVRDKVNAKVLVDPASGNALPIVDVMGLSRSPTEAAAVANRAVAALRAYVFRLQVKNGVGPSDRVQLQVLNQASASSATLFQPRSKVLPLFVLVVGLAATIGLIFVLENLGLRLTFGTIRLRAKLPGSLTRRGKPRESSVVEPSAAPPIETAQDAGSAAVTAAQATDGAPSGATVQNRRRSANAKGARSTLPGRASLSADDRSPRQDTTVAGREAARPAVKPPPGGVAETVEVTTSVDRPPDNASTIPPRRRRAGAKSGSAAAIGATSPAGGAEPAGASSAVERSETKGFEPVEAKQGADGTAQEAPMVPPRRSRSASRSAHSMLPPQEAPSANGHVTSSAGVAEPARASSEVERVEAGSFEPLRADQSADHGSGEAPPIPARRRRAVPRNTRSMPGPQDAATTDSPPAESDTSRADSDRRSAARSS
jgi:hypothetical protein